MWSTANSDITNRCNSDLDSMTLSVKLLITCLYGMSIENDESADDDIFGATNANSAAISCGLNSPPISILVWDSVTRYWMPDIIAIKMQVHSRSRIIPRCLLAVMSLAVVLVAILHTPLGLVLIMHALFRRIKGLAARLSATSRMLPTIFPSVPVFLSTSPVARSLRNRPAGRTTT